MDVYNWFRLNRNRLLPVVFVWALFATYFAIFRVAPNCPWKWHGGSPHFKGSCWCGADDYCMCTPSLAIDAIIEVSQPGVQPRIVLVRRRDPPRDIFATPGGFVDIGETVEAATRREVKEETNLDVVELEQFGVYSDPARDKRRHTVSVVFRCVVNSISTLKTGDDAKAVEIIDLKKVLDLEMAFDHKTILSDYIKKYHPQLLNK